VEKIIREAVWNQRRYISSLGNARACSLWMLHSSSMQMPHDWGQVRSMAFLLVVHCESRLHIGQSAW